MSGLLRWRVRNLLYPERDSRPTDRSEHDLLLQAELAARFLLVASIYRDVMKTVNQYECAYCGDIAQTFDHVIPRSRGGLDWSFNLVPACRRCNAGKRDDLPREWLVRLENRDDPRAWRVREVYANWIAVFGEEWETFDERSRKGLAFA